MIPVIITITVVFVVYYTNMVNFNGLEDELKGAFKLLMEDDYEFLVKLKFGESVNVDKAFNLRIRNGLTTIVVFIIVFLSNLTYINILIAVAIGFGMYKLNYINLKSFYKQHLNTINSLLPYYLKSLEILVQHYTVPVALARSIDSAPDIFKPGLKKLIDKIETGDSSVTPYMDFANEYPVRDSMRMMRLLYRLSLGSQENKQEQLAMFSKNVSTLQNKARELKYQARLESMEKRTMIMLVCTGGGILGLLMFAILLLMNV